MSTAPDHLLDELNPAQRTAVTHTDGPLLIVAGAGTGKTGVITRRIAWLIREGLAKPEEILALTFTDKAAGEMEERVDRLLPYGYVDLAISTFHAFGERVLRAHGLEIGLPNTFRVLDQTAQWLLLRKHWDSLPLNYYRPLGNPTRFLQAMVSHFSRAEDELVTPERYLEHARAQALDTDRAVGEEQALEAARQTEVAEVFHVYKRLLREEQALDFSDLINETLRLFRERPNVRAQYQNQFRYILVDEFQDTNYAQYQLVKLLAEPRQNMTVVGDDDQSIYKFRGASVSNILDFERDYPKAARVVLTTNYRSRQEILDTAYQFIQHNNPDRLEAKLGAAFTKKLEASRSGQGAIIRLHGKTVGDEARLVAEKIAEVRAQTPPVSWNEFAILVRANDHAEPFLNALVSRGIPHEFLAARGLFTNPLAIDILAYLRVLVDPFDSASLYRVLTAQLVEIGHDQLTLLLHHAHKKTLPLMSVLRTAAAVPGVSEDTVRSAAVLLANVDKHGLRARRERLGDMVLAFLHETGYLANLAKQSDDMARESMRVLQQFWKEIERYSAEDEDPTVAHFLDVVRLQMDAGDSGFLPPDPEAGPELVRVMTLHAAKGLEFGHVFLVNLVDRRFPTVERKEVIPLPDAFINEHLPSGDAHLQEERRLFYVGMTRAKDVVYLTSAEEYGGARKKKVSRFLTELSLPDATAEARTPIIEFAPEPRPQFAGFKIPDRMSFTQFAAFENCPLQYKYEHLLKIPKRGNGNQSFGQSVHGTLQEFFERFQARSQQSTPTLFEPSTAVGPTSILETIPVDELLEIYQQKFIDEWYTSQEQRRTRYEHGRNMLVAYYQSLKERTFDIEGLEIGFTLKFLDASVKGRIDRVDRLPDGGVEIIDYKTGSAKKDPDRDQLMIYQLAAVRVLGLVPKKLTYLYLDGGEQVSFLATDEELTAFEERINRLVASIRASTFQPTPDPRICKFCDFREICPSRAV